VRRQGHDARRQSGPPSRRNFPTAHRGNGTLEHFANDKTLYDSRFEIPPLGGQWKIMKIRDFAAAEPRSTLARHGPRALTHGRGIIEKNFLSRLNVTQSHHLQIVAQSRIRVA
jgi:hypothetical protein